MHFRLGTDGYGMARRLLIFDFIMETFETVFFAVGILSTYLVPSSGSISFAFAHPTRLLPYN